MKLSMNMTRTRRTALVWLLLCCGISAFWGYILASASPAGMLDFKAVYYGSRCLIQQSDPYLESEFLRVYQAEGGEFPSDPTQSGLFRRAVLVCINLPTALLLVAPFTILAWGPAHILWLLSTAGMVILAAFLMCDIGSKYASSVSLLLICILLANCERVVFLGNAAGIVMCLCVVAVWCFLEERFVPAGILCLAISLAFKPQGAGLIWLYFLLAGGVYRKRALQTLLVTAVLAIPAILWVTHIAPHWIAELHANLSAASAHGGINEPGPASLTGRTPGMVIDLQAAISVFWSDPRIYNVVSYLICGVLLLVGAARTLKSRFSLPGAWLALAAIAAISLLPVYHRQYDAKLLLLTVPACAMLWAEGGLIGWIALLLNTAGIVVTGDIPSAILLILTRNLSLSPEGFAGKILTVLLLEPAPLILLAMGIFYLWVYLRREPERG